MMQEDIIAQASNPTDKVRAARNQTLTLTKEEEALYRSRLISLSAPASIDEIRDKVICQDLMQAFPFIPDHFADLVVIDPPYNIQRQFGDFKTGHRSDKDYYEYIMQWLPNVLKWLKPEGSIYICCDWASSPVIYQAMQACGIKIRNRITWQREKGRGAKDNWKNGMEDIWYGVLDNKHFYFNVEVVKIRRKVIAPYRNVDGQPKDWEETENGKFRQTYPSNLWDDLSIPYWSMPENTDHPTQKPEKLLAKLILSSCPEGGLVADPFLGSGTTSVTARKLGRHFFGVEMNPEYVCWTMKRLDRAASNPHIQGFSDGVFWERNSGK